MTVLITGVAGMLGSSVYPVFKKKVEVFATDINLTDDWVEYLDVRDRTQIKKYTEKKSLALVLHLAAETDLETCELNSDDAFETNTKGTENIALLCKEKNIPLVYISTAGVFDGLKEGFYNEYDLPNPVNVYGKTKLEGEKVVENLLDKYFIIRAGWMIGGGEKDKKFIMKIMKQLDEGRKELFVVDDKYGTPTYTEDFANCMNTLIKTDHYGLYHMVCKGGGTRYDVASELLNFFGRNDVRLNRINSDQLGEYFGTQFFTNRPKSEMMENLKLEELGLNNMRDWKTALREYLSKYFNYKK